MKKEYYKKYTREEMADIGKNKGFYFVETSNGDSYQIQKDDISDFIVLETIRCNQQVDMWVYTPNVDEKPILSTMGWFLDKIKPKLREEIIDRLVKLQTFEVKPRKVKIFDNEIFMEMKLEEFGEQEGKTIQFDKFFKRYYEPDDKDLEEEYGE